MYIYVASSWRNKIQPMVVKKLREAGHDVYDFKNPTQGDRGFHWSDIDENWKGWTPAELIEGLDHNIAQHGFLQDMNALEECDVCVLVMPCGRSAHLELGFAVGFQKYTAILLCDGEPELMHKMAGFLAVDMEELLEWLREINDA